MIIQTEVAGDVQQSMSDMQVWFTTNQSSLIAAAALLAAGLVLAILLRLIAVRVISTIERTVPGRAFSTTFAGIARERRIADIVGGVAFWAVLLFFVATAANALGVPLLSRVVGSFAEFVPRVFGAVLILIVGLVVGNVARGTVSATATKVGGSFGLGLGQVARVTIILSAVLIALAEMGVDIAILTALFSVGLGALLGGFALAFGLGARTAISNIIGSHYLRKTLAIGQTVRIGDIEGVISDLTTTAVIIDVPGGRMTVPAKQFDEMPSMLVMKRETM